MIVTWRPTQDRRPAGRPNKTFVDLLQDTSFTTREIETCMQDKRLWRTIIGVRQSEFSKLVNNDELEKCLY